MKSCTVLLRRLFVSLWLVAATPTSSAAGDEKLLQPVRVISSIPTEVRKRTPRGAKTIQLGVYKIGASQSDVLLHLYADSGANSPSAHLDLFLIRGGHFKRVQSLKVLRDESYRVAPAPPVAEQLEPFAVHEVQWLDLKNQKQPIIAIKAPNFRGFDEGEVRLFIFEKGIAQKPTQQSFAYFDGYDASSWPFLSSVDKSGHTKLSVSYLRTGGGPDYVEEKETPYAWNGKQFAPLKEQPK